MFYSLDTNNEKFLKWLEDFEGVVKNFNKNNIFLIIDIIITNLKKENMNQL